MMENQNETNEKADRRLYIKITTKHRLLEKRAFIQKKLNKPALTSDELINYLLDISENKDKN